MLNDARKQFNRKLVPLHRQMPLRLLSGHSKMEYGGSNTMRKYSKIMFSCFCMTHCSDFSGEIRVYIGYVIPSQYKQ